MSVSSTAGLLLLAALGAGEPYDHGGAVRAVTVTYESADLR